MRRLVVLWMLAAPLGAVATAPPDAALASPAGGTREEREKLLGVELSAGFPEGFALSAAVQPLWWLRGSVGVAHNVLAPGVQGSATFLPLQARVTPTLTLEAGRFFETDVSGRLAGSFPSALDPALRRFGYTFYAAQLGVELGSRRSFLFFVRGGLAWVRSGLADVQGARSGSTTIDVVNPRLRATVPTASLGVLLFVW